MSRDKVVEELNKKYGMASIFKMDDKTTITEITALPTGSMALDIALGVGGFPRGRTVEIFGPEGSGKTLLSLSAIANTQKLKGTAAFIDVEHALTPNFARLIGVDTSLLYYSQPDWGEQALGIMEDEIKSGYFDIVVLDSVAGLVTEAELKKPLGDNKMAPTAILMAEALRRMTSIISKTKTVAIFINQLREKPATLFGSPEYTPGGRALKFYASIRIDARKRQVEKDSAGKPVGHLVECCVVKNKVAPPFERCHIKLRYNSGIDHAHDIIEVAKSLNIIEMKGSWYHYGGLKFNGNQELYSMQWETLDLLMQDIQKRIKDGEQGVAKEEGNTTQEGSNAPLAV
jgi:recombination protein RecA